MSVHGLAGGVTVPSAWPALTDEEVARVLDRPAVTIRWRSPRPFSAAAVVDVEAGPPVVVKRHHLAVRTTAQLADEHAFAAWLRDRGAAVPDVLGPPIEHAPWAYEVWALGAGDDRYRDVESWMPYADDVDARAAGAALAHLHLAADGYPAPARRPGVLIGGAAVAAATDRAAALSAAVQTRPACAAWLDRHAPGWLDEAAGLLDGWPPVELGDGRWGHGDWHPSNLLWHGGGVSAVFDLGLADRTSAAFDVAVALERAGVGWLALPTYAPEVRHGQVTALLDGYRGVAPLDTAAVAAALPVCHVDLALAELDLFAGVTGDDGDAALAWHRYLCGHLRWWRGDDGRRLLDRVAAA